MCHRINNSGLEGIDENRNKLFDNIKLARGSIVFLGDSITEYGQWEELINDPKVKNRGIAGDTTWGLLRRLDKITSAKPSMIFLMIGVNDFLFTDESEIMQNYEKIVQRIQRETPESQLIIQSVLPVNNQVKKIAFSNIAIRSLNEKLKNLAQQYDLPYLDIHDKLLDADGHLAVNFTADGVHINGAAYQIWKDIVTPYFSNEAQ